MFVRPWLRTSVDGFIFATAGLLVTLVDMLFFQLFQFGLESFDLMRPPMDGVVGCRGMVEDRVISVLKGDPRISWSSKCLLLMVGPEAEHIDLK